MLKNIKYLRYIAFGLLIAFGANLLGEKSYAQEVSLPVLAAMPGQMVHLSPAYNPAVLKGIKVSSDSPFKLEFILDRGNPVINKADYGASLKNEANRLVKYFLASLTIPEKDLWVNLSPYEKNRIVPDAFGQTQMGRDLLAQDYLLKQITASLMYPEDEIGKKFWKKVYEEARKRGLSNLPISTFNKVWIVPDKAIVYESTKGRSAEGENAHVATAYVVESKLKVMMEQDYVALNKSNKSATLPITSIKRQQSLHPKKLTEVSSQIMREVIIPELTREINEGKNFAQLRQVYNSLILATWYKKKIKDSILAKAYTNQNKIAGVNIDDPQEKQKIYGQYLQAFKKGAYSLIKEEQDPVSKQIVPRKYFAGGMLINPNQSLAMTSVVPDNQEGLISLDVQVDAAMNSQDLFKFQGGVFQSMHQFNDVERAMYIAMIIRQINEQIDQRDIDVLLEEPHVFNIQIGHLMELFPEGQREEYREQFKNWRIAIKSSQDPFAKPNDILWFVPSKNGYVRIPLKETDEAGKLLVFLFSLLKGDEFEADYTFAKKGEKKMPPDFWNTYSLQYGRRIYTPYIHPVVADAVLSLIDQMVEEGQTSIKMADIFGGDGSFLEIFDHKLREHFKGRALPQMTYYLVDGNQVNIDAAGERFRGNSQYRVIKHNLLATGNLPQELSGMDIVTSIGGGFNFQVANEVEARRLKKRIQDVLSDKGRLIITGLSMIYFTADDFRRDGFDVLNMSIPMHFVTGQYLKQLYVLKKTSANPAMLGVIRLLTMMISRAIGGKMEQPMAIVDPQQVLIKQQAFSRILESDGRIKDMIADMSVPKNLISDVEIRRYKNQAIKRSSQMEQELNALVSDLSILERDILDKEVSANEIVVGLFHKISSIFEDYRNAFNGIDEIDHLEKIYDRYIAAFNDDLVESISLQITSYRKSIRRNFLSNLNAVSSINELLHLMHTYAKENDKFYNQLILQRYWQIKRFTSIAYYGEESDLANKIFDHLRKVFEQLHKKGKPDDQWPGGPPNKIQIYSFGNEVHIVVSDYGHALTFEVEQQKEGKFLVRYRIPKVYDEAKVRALPGFSNYFADHYDRYGFANGHFEVVEEDIPEAISTFIGMVPIDMAMSSATKRARIGQLAQVFNSYFKNGPVNQYPAFEGRPLRGVPYNGQLRGGEILGTSGALSCAPMVIVEKQGDKQIVHVVHYVFTGSSGNANGPFSLKEQVDFLGRLENMRIEKSTVIIPYDPRYKLHYEAVAAKIRSLYPSVKILMVEGNEKLIKSSVVMAEGMAIIEGLLDLTTAPDRLMSFTWDDIGQLFDSSSDVVEISFKPDEAMPVNNEAMGSNKGGIDLSADKFLNVKYQGEAMSFQMDPAVLAKWQKASGVMVNIIECKPINNLHGWLGVDKI